MNSSRSEELLITARALTVFLTLLTGLCACPRLAEAQNCDWGQISLFADGYYSAASNSWTVYSDGQDLAAGCCYHTYYTEIEASTQASTYFVGLASTASAYEHANNEPGPVNWTVSLWIECWCVNAVVAFDQRAGQIQTPPPPTCTWPNFLPRSGVVRFYTYTYWISPSFTPDEEAGIVTAFLLWENKNAGAGTSVSFQRSTVAPAEIMVSKSPIPQGNAQADVSPPSGPMATGSIVYDPNRNPANPGELYVRKIFLHEIGHLHALADTPGVPAQSTVMLTNVSISDFPGDVTQCDADAARQKSS
jgi:hypothetical protein